jgi:hypothetical protein
VPCVAHIKADIRIRLRTPAPFLLASVVRAKKTFEHVRPEPW